MGQLRAETSLLLLVYMSGTPQVQVQRKRWKRANDQTTVIRRK